MSWQRFFHRAAWDEERRRELDAHLAHEIDDHLARGLSADEARAAAYHKVGNPTLVREEIYRMNTLERTERLWHDIRYAGRLLRRSPGFTAVALLSLALGIGANTAIFQLLDAVYFQTLPVSHPDQFVEVRIGNATHGRTGGFSSRRPLITGPVWQRLRDKTPSFSSLFAWSASQFDLSEGGESREAEGLWVSGSYFSALGVRPVVGRLIEPSDDVTGCGATPAVISEGFWRREFGRDPAIVGHVLHLERVPATIVGVSPASFRGVEVGHAFDVAVPICAEPAVNGPDSRLNRADGWWLAVMGRLAPGVSAADASTALARLSPPIFADTVSSRYSAEDVANYKTFTLGAFAASTGVSDLRRQYQQPLWVLLAIAGLVLLIASGNLANLLLARATAREREMAVRLAIGASRGRLVRQLLIESLLLAAIGAILGMWLAGAASGALVAFLSSPDNPLSFDLAFDWRVLGFTVAVGVVTCLSFGLVPALRATNTAPASTLRGAGRGLTETRERFTARRLLVVSQMALSLILAVSAVLFIRTFWNLAAIDPGFRVDGLVVGYVDYGPSSVPVERQRDFQAALTAAVGSVPGVAGAASASVVPLTDNGGNDTLILDGQTQKVFPNLSTVSPGYFRLLGIPIRAGRNFDAHDTLDAPKTALVNEAFVRTYLPGANALGRTFSFTHAPNEPDRIYTVVGIVGDTRYSNIHDPVGPIIYFPATQDPDPGTGMAILARSASDGATTAAILAAVRAASPVARVQIRRLDEIIRASLVREQIMASLAGFFGLLAALLAAIGLYGVMSYGVSRRRGEIGLRMALGAGRARVLRLILADASRMVLVGLGLGAVLAFLAARAAQSLLYNLRPDDPLTFGLALLVMLMVAALATLLPAARAARLDPTAALRDD